MTHPVTKKSCTKKRKRDKFLLASIFGGAREMSAFSKDTSERNRNESKGIKQALIGGLNNQNNHNPNNRNINPNQQNLSHDNPLNYLAFGGNPSYNPYPNNPNAYY